MNQVHLNYAVLSQVIFYGRGGEKVAMHGLSLLGVFLSLLSLIVPVVVLFFIIKLAVKQAVKEALREHREESR